MMHGIQTRSAADDARELDIHWVPKNPTDDDSSLYGTVWAFLVSIGHVTLIKENSFGAETWLITHKLKPEKECVVQKLSSSSNRERGSIVVS
jgi:hypothetical protein